MRRPSSAADQLAWWRAALSGPRAYTEDPQCGLFKVRDRAWSKTWLPVRITLIQEVDWSTGELVTDETPLVMVHTSQARDPWETWLRASKNPITPDEWRWLTARALLHSHGMRAGG